MTWVHASIQRDLNRLEKRDDWKLVKFNKDKHEVLCMQMKRPVEIQVKTHMG